MPTDRKTEDLPVVLTIAGFDPSGGAGVIADVKTFTAFNCFATAAVTSLTYQNTMGVYGTVHQTAEAVRSQVLPVIEDFSVACVKTGMLPTREVIEAVARLVREFALPAPVVDPVVRSTSGFDLIDDTTLASLTKELFPLSRIVTPNIPEAERITGLKIEDEKGMRRAASAIRELGARAVLIKGGHLKIKNSELSTQNSVDSSSAIDVLDDEGRVTVFRGDWIESTSTHGTGCTLSAAITACLGWGKPLEESVATAKQFVTEAIRQAPRLGHGHGPINPNVIASFKTKVKL